MISLDTSTTKSGWAYWENGILIEHGVIDLSIIKDKETRIDTMIADIFSLLNKKEPQTIVIEGMQVCNNASVQTMLVEIIGAVKGYCNFKKIEFVKLFPAEWRKYAKDKDEKIPRKRDELKDWAQMKVKILYDETVLDDEADAVLIGRARVMQFANMPAEA